MLLGGIGVGLALGTLIAAGATALPAHRSATGSAIINSSRQISSALGVALLVTVLGSAVGARHGYVLSWSIGAGLALLAAGASLALPRVGRAPDPITDGSVEGALPGIEAILAESGG
jgi:hypothetical protein